MVQIPYPKDPSWILIDFSWIPNRSQTPPLRAKQEPNRVPNRCTKQGPGARPPPSPPLLPNVETPNKTMLTYVTQVVPLLCHLSHIVSRCVKGRFGSFATRTCPYIVIRTRFACMILYSSYLACMCELFRHQSSKDQVIRKRTKIPSARLFSQLYPADPLGHVPAETQSYRD